MSDEQIKQIMQELAKQNQTLSNQNEVLAKLTKDGDDRAEVYGQLAQFMENGLQKTNDKLDDLSNDVAPVVRITKNVMGFDNVSKWILKLLFGLGALITTVGTIGYFLRKLILMLIAK